MARTEVYDTTHCCVGVDEAELAFRYHLAVGMEVCIGVERYGELRSCVDDIETDAVRAEVGPVIVAGGVYACFARAFVVGGDVDGWIGKLVFKLG